MFPRPPWAVYSCKKPSAACRAGPATQQLRVFWAKQHQLCGGQGSRVLPRWCAHCRFYPVQYQAWPFGGRLNTKTMVPSCRLHVYQAPHNDNNDSCPSSPRPPHNLVFPHTSLVLSSCHPSTGDQMSVCKRVRLCVGSIRGHLDF